MDLFLARGIPDEPASSHEIAVEKNEKEQI